MMGTSLMYVFLCRLLTLSGYNSIRETRIRVFMRKDEAAKPQIDIPLQTIERFCMKHHIQALALFGSVLTERFRKSSDVDILVQFEAQHIPGLIHLSELELELGEIFGRQVDLRTPKDLSRLFRNEVIAGAYHLYGKERFRPS
jgi:predicted nucleotidyltransferase